MSTTPAKAALEAAIKLACLIVLETPACSEKNRPHTPTARIRRDLIEQLEEKLTAAGYDFAAGRKRMKEVQREATAA